jgi:alkanesulfonate monooxygenase SsuD/methylene tetrahydromethanopterin reductase-like flavin-dependent oxidoreductase (luciferase family)
MAAPTFGILHDFRRPLTDTRPISRYYAECLDEVAEADRLGFDAVWMSEHHFTDDGLLPSPLVMAAAIAARTHRIRIGTNILVLPLHHPLRVAEDAAVVDLISGGRLVLGVGQGYAEKEFAAFRADRRRRGSLLEEGVEILRRMSSGRSPVSPQPERPLPIHVAGVTEAGIRRAARLGDALIIYCATPADLRARRALVDRIAPQLPLVCTSVLHVAATADQAWAEAAPGISYLEGQIARLGGGSELPGPVRADYLVGTVDEVAERLIALHHDVRFSHFAAWARLPGLSHTRSMQTLRLVAGELVPAVTAGLRSRMMGE